jgi:hypothetical protein
MYVNFLDPGIRQDDEKIDRKAQQQQALRRKNIFHSAHPAELGLNSGFLRLFTK